MQFHPNELFLVYNPQTSIGKQTKAIACDICKHINEVDVLREKLSPTYWKEIVNMIGVHPDDLLDHSHEDYKSKVLANTFTMDGWLEVLVHGSHLIKYPIVIFNGHAVMCQTPTDIRKIKHRAAERALPHLKDSH